LRADERLLEEEITPCFMCVVVTTRRAMFMAELWIPGLRNNRTSTIQPHARAGI